MSKVTKFAKKNVPTDGPLSIAAERISGESLTPAQREAEQIFRKWYRSKKTKKNQILRIGGGAGAGKSYWIHYIIEKYDLNLSNCFVMAYTGQAVNVLRQNGVMARTIHSTIMIPVEEPVFDKKTGDVITRHGVPLTKVRFRPVPSIPNTIKLVIIDEASFLPYKLEKILKRYNVPILEVGDPIQLPPVADEQVFTMNNLDYFMEGVMRQNADSEIFDLATKLRKCKNVNISKYCDDVRFLFAQQTIEETFYRFLPFFRDADIIITSTNKQRQIITDLYRREIIGTNSPFPREGERMICRKNNQELMLDQYMLTNGTQGYCMYDVGHSDRDKTTGTYIMNFKPDVVADDPELYYDNLVCDEEFLQQPFGTANMVGFKHPGEKFEFAHAITTHLAQGSSYPTVLFMDAFCPDLEYLMRLRYTAVTRARERLWYIVPYSQYPGWCDLKNIEDRWRMLHNVYS